MGTPHTHLATVQAATRPGGRSNQDRYVTGTNFAAVLDGASSFGETIPGRDGGWYADALAQHLAANLARRPEEPTPDLVGDAISETARRHNLTVDSTPTSTVAIARWTDTAIDIYLLGDCTAAVLFADGHEEARSDARLAGVARPQREAYRQRLAAGSGFDSEHRRLLQKIQAEQRAHRNRDGGYWIAGPDPEAAHHAQTWQLSRHAVTAVLVASDGAAAGVSRYRTFATWRALAHAIDHDGPDEALQQIERIEMADPTGQRWPRSKPADDKTLAYVRLQ